MNKNSRIYVAGHRGMVGSAIVRCLEKNGYRNLVTRTHRELDLTCQDEVNAFFAAEKVEYLFIAAAKVGGILANDTYPAEFIYKNLMIECNLIHAAWKNGVKRLLFLGSSCIYPRESPQPMREEHLLTGTLEPTNEPYAIAKIAGIKLCESYNRQYDTDFRSAMPTNLYGPNDNYNLETSHVLPAMIRKFHLATLAEKGKWDSIVDDEKCYGDIPADIMKDLVMISKRDQKEIPTKLVPLVDDTHSIGISFWGTGRAKREFLHVDDLADACLFVMNLDRDEYYCHTKPMLSHINVGTGSDITIRELADTIRQIVGYEGEMYWDASKPDGTMRKSLNTGLLEKMGWTYAISMKEGIKQSYTAYLQSRLTFQC
jgi:GDP-L-fucose synthase